MIFSSPILLYSFFLISVICSDLDTNAITDVVNDNKEEEGQFVVVHSLSQHKVHQPQSIEPTKTQKKEETLSFVVLDSAEQSLTKEGVGSDKHEECCDWAQQNECESNPVWMWANCPKACTTNGCKVPIDISLETTAAEKDPLDQHILCCFWTTQGHCTTNEQWMTPNCPFSCKNAECLAEADVVKNDTEHEVEDKSQVQWNPTGVLFGIEEIEPKPEVIAIKKDVNSPVVSVKNETLEVASSPVEKLTEFLVASTEFLAVPTELLATSTELLPTSTTAEITAIQTTISTGFPPHSEDKMIDAFRFSIPLPTKRKRLSETLSQIKPATQSIVKPIITKTQTLSLVEPQSSNYESSIVISPPDISLPALLRLPSQLTPLPRASSLGVGSKTSILCCLWESLGGCENPGTWMKAKCPSVCGSDFCNDYHHANSHDNNHGHHHQHHNSQNNHDVSKP